MDVNVNDKFMLTDSGFAYDLRRGVLCAGSWISGKGHPLADVEALKIRLIEEGAVAKREERFECLRDIETGPLMAYNLCRGQFQKELPDCLIAFDEEGDELIPAREAWKLWAMYSPDEAFRARIEKDSYRITKIMEARYDYTFVNGKGDGSLSKVEQFVVDALKAAGAIDEWRRGDAMQHECDIVDEAGGRQIEFVSLFDEKIPPRIRYANELNEEQALVLEYTDFGYNVVAKGVINKFTLKNYTDRYDKELAIYTIGPAEEGADKIQALQEKLSARIDQIRNNYKRIHIILHDPLVEESFIYCSNDRFETYPDNLCSENIVERHPASIESIDPDKNYFVVKTCIFNQSDRSLHWAKGEQLFQNQNSQI